MTRPAADLAAGKIVIHQSPAWVSDQRTLKEPKTKRSRTLDLPPRTVEAVRRHQHKSRKGCGLGTLAVAVGGSRLRHCQWHTDRSDQPAAVTSRMAVESTSSSVLSTTTQTSAAPSTTTVGPAASRALPTSTGVLEPGEFAAPAFEPPFRFLVGEGWSLEAHAPSLVILGWPHQIDPIVCC